MHRGSHSTNTQFLVKWGELGCEACSWEDEADLGGYEAEVGAVLHYADWLDLAWIICIVLLYPLVV